MEELTVGKIAANLDGWCEQLFGRKAALREANFGKVEAELIAELAGNIGAERGRMRASST